jgi:hypothetical protein
MLSVLAFLVVPAILRGKNLPKFSLEQILHQVAAEMGAKVKGLTQDQRIFGNYGPGPGCDVLAKLLYGSGYNMLIIGSRDADAPLEIVLSARSPASPRTARNNQNRSNSEAARPASVHAGDPATSAGR